MTEEEIAKIIYDAYFPAVGGLESSKKAAKEIIRRLTDEESFKR